MKKYSNKILLIALAALIGIFVLSRVFRSSKLESNLRKDLVLLDTAKVTEVRIQSSATESNELKLVKAGRKWKVVDQGKEANAEDGTVESMLGVAMSICAQRLVTRKKEKWEEFEVGENSTRVTVFDGTEKLADFRIGKFGFPQGQQQSNGIDGIYTYVRLTNEDEVYSSEGFIASHFNRSFDQWRDKTFLRIQESEVNRVDFIYPDSSFVLEKRDSVWFAGDRAAIPAKVTQYFSKISTKNINEFASETIQSSASTLRLQINGASGVIASVQAWPKEGDDWFLESSFQEGVNFVGKKAGVIKDIFPGKGWFVND